jgi:preprotein translocase subunit SecF
MFQLPNIYSHKNLKYLIVLPLALMIFGIYFSTQLTYDTTLAGGVTILLQTNSTQTTSQLASAISAKLNSGSPSVSVSPGSLQITLTMNQSLSEANAHLLAFDAQKANYSSYLLNATALSLALQRNSTNSTLKGDLVHANAQVNESLASMRSSLQAELASLKPFGVAQAVGTANPDQMQQAAQDEYTNASATYKNDVISALHTILPFSSYSYEEITPTLGQFFLQELTNTIVLAFVLVFIVVFLIFRSPIPSLVVVFGAANDMIFAIGAMALLRIPLGVASIAGLLMLIGYSIDTDVLTAIRILRRGEGKPEDRAYASMKTGVTMTATAIVSFGALFAVSVIAYVPTYYEIAGVVLIGLVGDVITTWFGNASLILMYKKRKDGA